MARKASHAISYRLTKFETIAGWLYLPFYLLILNLLLQLANVKFSLGMTALTMNLVYFAVNLLAVLLIFHGFLRQSFFGGSFWNFVQALVLGFAMYYAGTWVLQFALSRLAPGFTIYNNETVGSLISDNQYVMLAVTVFLAPIIEETLVRGLRLHSADVARHGVSRVRYSVHAHAQLAVFHALSCRKGASELHSVSARLRRAGLDV